MSQPAASAAATSSPPSFQLSLGQATLIVRQGDVLSLAVDALVCPVDANLDFRSGIARVVSRAAGKEIRQQRPAAPEPYGKVVVLPGGKLKAKYLFLTVLLGERGPDKMRLSIREAVERTIRYADFLRLSSMAFPLLGSAEFSPPYCFVAGEMLKQVRRYFARNRSGLRTITFSAFTPEAFLAFRREAEIGLVP